MVEDTGNKLRNLENINGRYILAHTVLKNILK